MGERTMAVRIVPMKTEHLDAVAELERTCFTVPWSRNALAEELDNALSAFLVALDEEERVVGYAGLQVVLDEGYITNVAVRPDCRRRGVAGKLLDVFERFAEGNHLAFLSLEVRASNYAAIALYGQHGYRGVVPEIASRKHVEAIAALTDKALADAGVTKGDIDAVAVTYAPGLIGAVLVGLSFAKSVAYALGVPLIPVHHIRGHIAANYLAFPELEPPFLALCMSGGNTLFVDVRDYTDLVLVGATRDDAAGECFDKAARVLGMPYPGGKPMDELAQQSAGGVYDLPRASIEGHPLDMSFSGLKTAVVNLAHNAEQKGEPLDRAALARDFTRAVSDELVPRAMLAARTCGRKTLVAAGGVAANTILRADLMAACAREGVKLDLPPLRLCGDNGAMIGAQGYYEYLAGARADLSLNAYATRDIDDAVVAYRAQVRDIFA